MITRRHLLGTAGAGAALAVSGLNPKFSNAEAAIAELTAGLPAGVASYATMETLPGKKPLIRLADRPPNYESPLEYLRTPITPNDQFFVRYHLADIPEVDAKTYKIAVGGDGVDNQAEISFDDLKKLPAVEVVAVNQCSGNRRGLSNPHVAGVEWGYGAMGCARWKGAKLKDILDKAGLKKEAIEISFNGADGPSVDKTPDFIKSIPAWKAIEDYDDCRLRNEWAAAPAPQRIPRAYHCARLDRHVLDEARHRDQCADQTAGWILDEPRLSDSARKISDQRPVHQSGDSGQHAHHRDGGQLADHQPSRRRESEGR